LLPEKKKETDLQTRYPLKIEAEMCLNTQQEKCFQSVTSRTYS